LLAIACHKSDRASEPGPSYSVATPAIVPAFRRKSPLDGLTVMSHTRLAHLTASDVMTVTEVAKMLGVPTSTVHHWAREGTIPSRKIGRRRIFIRQKIEALLLSDSR
jgi:excisionase family DNA binding protein